MRFSSTHTYTCIHTTNVTATSFGRSPHTFEDTYFPIGPKHAPHTKAILQRERESDPLLRGGGAAEMVPVRIIICSSRVYLVGERGQEVETKYCIHIPIYTPIMPWL